MSRLADESAFEPENSHQRGALAFLRLEGSSRESAPFPGAGDRVADFVIEQELGRGGAGVVYRARQDKLGRSVALKLIPHGPAALTEAYARRLEREGRMLAAVKHEAIPTVHAAGVVPGFHYVAVDLVEGTTLKDLIHGRASGFPRPGDARWLPFLLGLLRGVAGALAAAHARGIVHRDVKPGNVLVDRAGRPFLVDFGLARETGVTGATLTHGFVGTPQYASPEQLKGEPLGAASDVFSFGVLAFEAVTGKRPFRSERAHDLAHEILSADPKWPAVPRDLRTVIDRCLEKRPARRYSDARDVEAELARLLNFEQVRAAPRGRVARARSRIQHHPVLATAALGALVTCLGIGAVVFHQRWASSQEKALEDQVAAVFRLFGMGRFDDYRRGLDELMRIQPPPPRVAGRSADLHFLSHEPETAFPLYEHEFQRGSAELADWVGFHATRAVVEGHVWEVDLDGMPEPFTARDFMVLALSHELEDNIPAALEQISQAVNKTPMPVELHLLKVKYLRKLGKTSQLARELGLTCQLRTWDETLFCMYAQTLHRLHRYEEEMEFLERARATKPGEPLLLAELALCKSRLGQRAAGFELARQAYVLAPEQGRVVEALAFHLVAECRHEEAHLLLRDAALALPGEPHVLAGSAHLALQTGALDEAARLAEELVSIGARDERWLVRGLELRGRTQAALGAYPEALATFQGLEAREPEIMDWPLAIGAMLEKTGEPARAEAALDRALDLGLIEPEVLWAKASLLRAAGRPEEALLVLGPGLWRPADASTTYYWMALTWLDLGESDAALFCARQAVKAHDAWPEARDLLARCEAAADAAAENAGAGREENPSSETGER